MKNIAKILKQALRKSAQNIIEEGPKQLLTEQTYGAGAEEWACGANYGIICGTNPWPNNNGILAAGHPGCDPTSSTPYHSGTSTITGVGIKIDHVMPNGGIPLDASNLNIATPTPINPPGAGGVANCLRPFHFKTTMCPIQYAMDTTAQTDPCHMDNFNVFAPIWTGTSLPTAYHNMYSPGAIGPDPGAHAWFQDLLNAMGMTAPAYNINIYCEHIFGTAACSTYTDIYNMYQAQQIGNNTLGLCAGGGSQSPCTDSTCAGSNVTPCMYGFLSTFDCVSGLCEENFTGTGAHSTLQDCATSTACQMYKCDPNQAGGNCDPCDYATEYGQTTLQWNCQNLDDACTGAPCSVPAGCTFANVPGYTFPQGCPSGHPANGVWPNWYEDQYGNGYGGQFTTNCAPCGGPQCCPQEFLWDGPTVTGLSGTYNSGDYVPLSELAYLLVNGSSYCEWCYDMANSGGSNQTLLASSANWHQVNSSGTMVPWSYPGNIEDGCCCCTPASDNTELPGGFGMVSARMAAPQQEIEYVCSENLGCLDVNTEDGSQAVYAGGIVFPNFMECERECRPPRERPRPSGRDVCCDWCATVDPNVFSIPPVGCEDWNCDNCDNQLGVDIQDPVIQPLVQQEGLQIKGKLLNESRMKRLAGIIKKRK